MPIGRMEQMATMQQLKMASERESAQRSGGGSSSARAGKASAGTTRRAAGELDMKLRMFRTTLSAEAAALLDQWLSWANQCP